MFHYFYGFSVDILFVLFSIVFLLLFISFWSSALVYWLVLICLLSVISIGNLLFGHFYSFGCRKAKAQNDCGLINQANVQKSYASRPHGDCAPTQNKHKSQPKTTTRITATADNVYENCINNSSDIGAREQVHGGASKANAIERNASKLFGKPPSGEKCAKQFVGLSSDEREMPITRERSKIYQPNTVKRCSDDSSRARKLKSIGSPRLHQSSKYLDSYSDRLRYRYVYTLLLLNYMAKFVVL